MAVTQGLCLCCVCGGSSGTYRSTWTAVRVRAHSPFHMSPSPRLIASKSYRHHHVGRKPPELVTRSTTVFPSPTTRLRRLIRARGSLLRPTVRGEQRGAGDVVPLAIWVGSTASLHPSPPGPVPGDVEERLCAGPVRFVQPGRAVWGSADSTTMGGDVDTVDDRRPT